MTIISSGVGEMANLIIENVTYNGAGWWIGGFDNHWNTTYYNVATVSTGEVPFGSTNPPSGILGSLSAPTSGSLFRTPTSHISLSPQTSYTLYGSAQTSSGFWYPAGSWSFTTPPDPSTRPSDFQWQYSQTVSQAFVPGTDANHAIHRDDWNNLTARINQFRVYKGMSAYSFTTAFYNMVITASVFNEARNAIVGMIPPNPPVGVKQSGDVVRAADISGLRYALNSIT